MASISVTTPSYGSYAIIDNMMDYRTEPLRCFNSATNTDIKRIAYERIVSPSHQVMRHDHGISEHNADNSATRTPSTPVKRQTSSGAELTSTTTIQNAHSNHTEIFQEDSSLVTAKHRLSSKSSAGQGDVRDMICIGMGPASLAIGVALADALHKIPVSSSLTPEITFLEKQGEFAWHPGMQIADAKMQISFLKDMATPRDPTSPFSFTNYLHVHGRLNKFLNLGTFLPSRLEYQAYMRWCADHFEGATRYGAEVKRVEPVFEEDGKTLKTWKVTYNQTTDGSSFSLFSRRVVMAAGGQPCIPKVFQRIYETQSWSRPQVSHSSQYKMASPLIDGQYNPAASLVVIGSGQSSAEIYSDLCSRYPDRRVTLICRAAALKPSDDSPFVNEVFDPERVDDFYGQGEKQREAAIIRDRATNYSVVRSELIDHIYYHQYMQELEEPDCSKHRHRILFNTQVHNVDENLNLYLESAIPGVELSGNKQISAQHVFVATGYKRDLHNEVLAETRQLLPATLQGDVTNFPIGRDYRIQFSEAKVPKTCGIWLQGCNEATHGLSDSLLSILAVRGGEIVSSIFGANHEDLRR